MRIKPLPPSFIFSTHYTVSRRRVPESLCTHYSCPGSQEEFFLKFCYKKSLRSEESWAVLKLQNLENPTQAFLNNKENILGLPWWSSGWDSKLRMQGGGGWGGGSVQVPGQGTGSHMPQLRACMLQLKILHAANKRAHMPQQGASQVALVVKNPPVRAGDVRDASSIPGSGRSLGEGHGNPLQYSSLENPMDRGAWWATVHRITKSQTRLSTYAAMQVSCASTESQGS